jgi:DNA-binding transcriptional LysR family regulator
VALFDRVGRNVRLTEAGEALLPHARAVMAQVEAARAEMAERIGLSKGRATVGTPPTAGTQLLPPVLAAFNKRYPGIELRLHEAGVQTLLDLLETGLTDVAVVTLPVEDGNLTVVPLFTEEMVVAVWAGHHLAECGEVAFSDLRSEPWVLSPENYELREAMLGACHVANFTPRVVLDGGETDTLLRFVAAGVGIALVPRLAVQGVSDIRTLRVSDQNLSRSLGIVWRGDRVASPAARALRDFMVQELKTG